VRGQRVGESKVVGCAFREGIGGWWGVERFELGEGEGGEVGWEVDGRGAGVEFEGGESEVSDWRVGW